MSVRDSLLAILDVGPCYGHQLRAEFERRTGRAWPLNVGQVYNTLDRLERDGLVTRGAPDAAGHVHWRISARGSARVAAWLRETPARDTRDDLALKVAIAATLPGRDAAAIVRDQAAALRAAASAPPASDADPVRRIIDDALRERADADLRWLERTADLLESDPLPQPLAADRPRRGRPRARPQGADAAGGGSNAAIAVSRSE